jgi:hypothetical protein
MPLESTLSDLRTEFGRSRMLSLPIAGAIVWTLAGILGALLPDDDAKSIALFVVMPAVFPLGYGISRVLGEDLFATKNPNELDQLFLFGILMSNLVWCIAIPFWMLEPSSLPLSAGVLAGLMWVPLSWILQHWVGLFHAIARSVLAMLAWLLFPTQRFVIIPALVVLVYLISIGALATRKLPESKQAARTDSAAS